MTGPASMKDEPVNHVLPAWDLAAGTYAAFALLAAERHRRDSGQGSEARIPLSDVAITSLANLGSVAEVHVGDDRPRTGNDLFGAFGRDFRSADGQQVMVIALTPRQWSGLVAALSLHGAVAAVEKEAGVSFKLDEGLRFRHRDKLVPLVEAAISTRRAEDLAKAFDQHGVCWAPYRTLKAALSEDPRLCLSNSVFSPLTHLSGYQYPTPGAAMTLQGIPRSGPRRAAHLGEHTDEVLAEVLGLSAHKIGELHDRGIVATRALT
jgi:2-methylfumaryl-CoA isomerase